MNLLSFFKMDKDRGYAWVILGASTILMCVGPSTYTAFGFLFRDVPLTLKTKAWLLNIFYVCWLLSAFLVSYSVKQRPRQLATTGAAIAAVGFLTSASMAADPSWIYLTFSLFVGCGLGLSFHTAYLVVMSNFDHYKGLANGVCQLCIAIGQITTPFLFTIVALPRDRFQIKALTTAIGFLTTLFFVLPSSPTPRRATIADGRNRRPSTISRRGSMGEGVPLHSGFVVPASNSIPINNNQGQVRTRRRSLYLQAVSTSLLPNIPEEPESAHSTNDTLTSASSESELAPIQPSSIGSQSVAVITPDKDVWSELAPLNPLGSNLKVKDQNERNASDTGAGDPPKKLANQHMPLRRLSEGCLPAYAAANSTVKSNNVTKPNNDTPTSQTSDKRPVAPVPRIRRHSDSESQTQSTNNSVNPSMTFNNEFTTINLKSQENLQMPSKKPQQEVQTTQKKTGGRRARLGESIIDLNLLKDYQFLNMVAFTSLCTMTVVNYPIVLYVYIISVCETCTKEADMALIIIYMVDLISRLVFSYLADFAAISKRRCFHVGCACAGVLIAVTTLVNDMSLIYCFCVVYGVSVGLIVTSEYLMFIECFGFQRFPHAYGVVNLCKVVVVIALGVIAINPLAPYLYPIHPLDQTGNPKNITSYGYIDFGESTWPNATSTRRILLGLAVPSFLCALAWLAEDVYNHAMKKCSMPATEKSEARNVAVP